VDDNAFKNPSREKEPSDTRELTPDVQPLPPADYVTTEAQLDVIGYFDAGYKRRFPQPKEQKTIALSQGRTVNIVPSAKYGYPNTEDLDILRGFEKICAKRVRMLKKFRKGKVVERPTLDLPITYSTRELLIASGKKPSARDWQAVRDWAHRHVSTGIEGELYDAKSERYQRLSTHFFRIVYATGDPLPDGDPSQQHQVWPEAWWLRNFYYHYTTRRDHSLHQRLRKPIARNLYPLLDQAWYATDGQPYAKLYSDLATHFALTVHKHLSLIKQQLDPAHRDLQANGFLERWEYRRAADGMGFVITYWPGPKWRTDQQTRKQRRLFPIDTPHDPSPDYSSPEENHDLADLLSRIQQWTGDTHSDPFWRQQISLHGLGCTSIWFADAQDADRNGNIKTTRAAYLADLLTKRCPRHSRPRAAHA
jgi:hypothetical protein